MSIKKKKVKYGSYVQVDLRAWSFCCSACNCRCGIVVDENVNPEQKSERKQLVEIMRSCGSFARVFKKNVAVL